MYTVCHVVVGRDTLKHIFGCRFVHSTPACCELSSHLLQATRVKLKQ